MPQQQQQRRLHLRAHHLLCLFGFRGLGYSTEFVDNFYKLLRRIRANPQVVVKLSCVPDDICSKCPHLINRRCCRGDKNSEVEVKLKDKKVLAKLGLKVGCSKTAEELLKIVKAKILPQEISKICAPCPWLHLGYCESGLKEGLFGQTL